MSIADGISFIRTGVLFCNPKISSAQILLRFWPDLALVRFEIVKSGRVVSPEISGFVQKISRNFRQLIPIFRKFLFPEIFISGIFR